MRVALYARVSTKQHGQDVETQLQALKAWAKQKKLTIADIYADRGWSGAKARRPELDRLMQDARRRKFDSVVVWRFDRFARSVRHLLAALDEFSGLGIDFVSLTEAIDTSTAAGKLVFTVLAAVAEMMLALTRENVRCGVERARREGKQLGRPRKKVDEAFVKKALARGCSKKQIARELGIARSTVRAIEARGKPEGTEVRRRPGRRKK